MAGAYLGVGEPDVVIDVGVSGPGVVNKALQRAIEESGRKLTLSEIAEVIKHTAYKVTRVGELIGRRVAKAMNIPFGVADLSLAPTPAVGDSVGEIFQTLGLSSIGAPGSTAILAMLNDAVKKGGVFASSHVGGLSGAFIPVSEDSRHRHDQQQDHSRAHHPGAGQDGRRRRSIRRPSRRSFHHSRPGRRLAEIH